MNLSYNIDIPTIVGCFQAIQNPNTDPLTRKNADNYLIQIQKNPIELLPIIMEIVQTNSNDQIKFQALLFFTNVIKRTWTSRRLKQVHSAYETLKKNIKKKIIMDLYQAPKILLFTYFDIVKYIAKVDFPHAFPEFTQLVVKMTEQIGIDQNSVARFKQLKEIFNQLALRKGSVSIKLYQQFLQPIFEKMFIASSYLENQIEKRVESSNLDSKIAKLSKYTDQIVISILRMGPNELLDNEQTLMITKQLHGKLNHLLGLHGRCQNGQSKSYMEKNIKSLIYDLSALQQNKPFIITLFISDYFVSVSQIIANPTSFIKNTTLKYTLLALRKFIKQFAYYSDDDLFMTSIGSKTKSKNYLNLRSICHKAYIEALNPQTIESLLNHLIANLMCAYCRSENVCFDIEENMIIDKSHEKEMTIETCTILLVQAILQKFTDQSHNLIKNMIISSFKNNFIGIDLMILSNIFGVLALLPRTSKKNNIHSLNEIPIVEILGFIYQEPQLKSKIPPLISGWFDYFSNQQLVQLIGVLLDFIQNENDTGLILNCCQSLDKIIVTKKYLLNVDIISKIFPIAIRTFQKTESPQVLWPMVNLISNMIIQCEFDSDIILNSLQGNSLSVLISSNSTILIQALSQMFKNILCVIPRHKPAHAVFQLVCHFLNNHLSKLSSISSEKVLNLWYIVVREYSLIQNCNDELVQLYHKHYKNNLFYKTPLLIYILEEYMLLGFVEKDIAQFSLLIYEFYQEAQEMDKNQAEQIKVAALSFQITLITKYTLKQVNNQGMLKAILKDFYCLDVNQVSTTVHNSLLSIINRYLILHKDDFFSFLISINADIKQFYHVYLDNMQFLTSESAKKINAIAVLSLMPYFDQDFLINKLHYILMTIISSIQIYISTQQINALSSSAFTGKIMNSPTHRFASNFLSERKQEIRRKDLFEQVNLQQLFKMQISIVCSRLGINIQTLAQSFPQNDWGERFYKLTH